MASTEITRFLSGELSSNGRIATAPLRTETSLVPYPLTAPNAFFGHFAYQSPHPAGQADNGAERILHASPHRPYLLAEIRVRRFLPRPKQRPRLKLEFDSDLSISPGWQSSEE